MTFMEGPTVIRFYEVPALYREMIGKRISLDVSNRSANVVGVMKEDFPTAADPDRMILWGVVVSANPQAALLLEGLDHLFNAVLVFADDQMNVIEENRACVAGVMVVFHRGSESRGDGREMFRTQAQLRMREARRCFLVELFDDARRRLDRFAFEMKFAEGGEVIDANGFRCAPTRIVGQSPTVERPHEVMGNHDRGGH